MIDLTDPRVANYPFRIFHSLGRGGPIKTGLSYAIVALGTLYIFGFATGNLKMMYTALVPNISLGVIAPIGGMLLSILYRRVDDIVPALLGEDVVAQASRAEFSACASKLDRRLRSVKATAVAAAAGFAMTALAYVGQNDFTSIGGPTTLALLA